MWRVAVGLLILLGCRAAPARAQFLPRAELSALSLQSVSKAAHPPHARPAVTQVPAQRDDVTLVLAGVVGGAVGLFAGGYVGGKALEGDCEDCDLLGLVYGGIIGEAAGVPLGIHLANGRRGSYGVALLPSLAIAGAGIALAGAADRSELLLAVPVFQVVSSIAVDRMPARKAAR